MNEAIAALNAVEAAMLRRPDGTIAGLGWNITALNRARPLIHSALANAPCPASPDHKDILESIENAAPDWQTKGYPSALAEVRDMANVGRALMEALPKGYHYNDCPTEIVSDLQNQIVEASITAAEARRHATELEQCSIFAADVGTAIAKAMTDAAAFLRGLAGGNS